MTNIFLNEPIYITVDEIKDTTSKSSLANLEIDDIKILISKAEILMDNYIVRYGIKYNTEQTRIFPVNEEDIAVIPNEIKLACFYTVEQIHMNGDTVISSNSVGGDIVQEKVGDRSITYSESSMNGERLEQMGLPKEAKIILDKYRKVFYNVSL